MITDLIHLGKKIYNTDNLREAHRFVVFVVRAILHYPAIAELMKYFEKDELHRRIFARNPFPVEQITRAFFYKGSTLDERSRIVRSHYDYLQSILQDKWAEELSLDQGYTIWQSEDMGEDWLAELRFETGQRKEGLLSVEMKWQQQHLYQIMFWISPDQNGEMSMWIGALQGPNMENARDVVKEVTKLSHRYRTKNLILYMVMAVARSLQLKHIYAVSNEGYYANNHVRRDRKLKTDFGAFWVEAGGHETEDKRFYELPLVEPRKTMEEVPTRKRAVYRKRFEFQDDVDRQIEIRMQEILK